MWSLVSTSDSQPSRRPKHRTRHAQHNTEIFIYSGLRGSSSTGSLSTPTGTSSKAYYTDTDRDLRHLSMDVVSPEGDLDCHATASTHCVSPYPLDSGLNTEKGAPTVRFYCPNLPLTLTPGDLGPGGAPFVLAINFVLPFGE